LQPLQKAHRYERPLLPAMPCSLHAGLAGGPNHGAAGGLGTPDGYANMTVAVYRLSDQSPSFEFFFWLVLVVARGATEIVVDPSNPKTSKMSTDDIELYINSVVIPGAGFARVPISVKTGVRGMTCSAQDLLPWVRAGGTFKRLESVIAPMKAPYTVTMRNHKRAKNRNSNAPAWRQFAQEIGAFVIEDYADDPIHIYDRMALYAGATMNFGVCNGPMGLLALSPYPLTSFVPNESSRNAQLKFGVALNDERWPWMLPTQRLVWEPDTIENLRRWI
jgi:hypothetical protein